MLSFISKIVAMSIFIYLCIVAPSASGRIDKGTASLSRYRTDATRTKPTRPAGVPKSPHDNRYNPSSTSVPRGVRRDRQRDRSTQTDIPLRNNANKARIGARKSLARSRAATPTKQRRQNEQPTPEPTGDASASTTVYVYGPNAFALLLPQNSGEMVSDAEEGGIAYCTDGSGCGNPFPNGLITGAAYSASADGSYVQITGCMDSSKFPFADNDDGGQFDVRYPNGAQCTFGGYGASFIEQVEPSANRFCLRCCKSANDQQNCNSHQDRAGCPVAVPGTYEFGEVGCS
ncbi:hypothetical protein L210DRAFT_3561208 [Boletus edulis BED1]|uniref:Secreted protein n=1 Tax=Boletus edulis BED1 TaxID=1328754 RepID=A0AAD4G9C2_BOLED|nr:hypothetical protein L210DRAFT_3561208 [Boletus edulis BED1]